jgi:hypothetical protein
MRIPPSEMLRRVALVRTDVSEEPSASTIHFHRSVRRLLVTASVAPGSLILVTLMMQVPGSSETSVLTRATQRNIPEDDILHRNCRENLKSYNPTILVQRHNLYRLLAPDATIAHNP